MPDVPAAIKLGKQTSGDGMLSRQRTVLRMLASTGPGRNKLDLVKLLFLLGEEHSDLPRATRHEFVPYHRGPYSFTLAYDLAALERSGMVTQGVCDVRITTLGSSEADDAIPAVQTAIDNVRRFHGGKSTHELIDHVYDAHRWFTMNSKWTERRAMPRPKSEARVYTVGYEDVTLDGLLGRLIRSGVERLIDVRANPVARRFGFHKSTLARICPKVGIEYVHLPEVGVPSSWRGELDSVEDYRALFVRYAEEVLPDSQATLERLVGMIHEKPSALMCREADPSCCHRTTLAAEVSRRTGLEVRDLGQEVVGGLF